MNSKQVIEKLENELKDRDEMLSVQKVQIQYLKEQLVKFQQSTSITQLKDLEQQTESLKKEITKYQNEKVELQNQLSHLTSQLETSTKEKSTLHNQLSHLHTEHRKQLESLENQIKTTQSETEAKLRGTASKFCVFDS